MTAGKSVEFATTGLFNNLMVIRKNPNTDVFFQFSAIDFHMKYLYARVKIDFWTGQKSHSLSKTIYRLMILR
jgi:hypothetical protein